MKLISIEPTPSPNSMKLNVNELLPRGQRHDYKASGSEQAPELYRKLLAIPGVKGVFRTADFIALDRRPGADWSAILGEASLLFDNDGTEQDNASAASGVTSFGEAQVLVQMYRGIPMQIRVRFGDSETRAAMPERFMDAVTRAAGSTMIRERKLEEFGVRYGEPEEIAAEIIKELEASYTSERLEALIEASLAQGSTEAAETQAPIRPKPLSLAEVEEKFQSDDWQERYAALDRYVSSEEGLQLLAKAVKDENTSIRRLAVIYLGDLQSKAALPYLFTALKDSSTSVRRTAGDTLSDLGFTEAIAPMIESLQDKNKLVRWRAARFLYEAGDETALDALKEAAKDPEFEIQLQARMAQERIERGEEAAGSIWQQMTASRKQQG